MNAALEILDGPGTREEKLEKIGALGSTPEAEAGRRKARQAFELLAALYRNALDAKTPRELIETSEAEMAKWSNEELALAASYAKHTGEGFAIMEQGLTQTLVARLVRETLP